MGRGLYRCPPLGAHIGAGRASLCVHDVFDVGAVNIVIHWAAELRRMAVSWPWLRRRGDGTYEAHREII